jgi:hypothetical protein
MVTCSSPLFLCFLDLLDDDLEPNPKSGGVGVSRHGDSGRQQADGGDQWWWWPGGGGQEGCGNP